MAKKKVELTTYEFILIMLAIYLFGMLCKKLVSVAGG